MHDNLRLQRLVQQLALLVEEFVQPSEEPQADAAASTGPDVSQERHQEIMSMAKAVFREMSLQVFRQLVMTSNSLLHDRNT